MESLENFFSRQLPDQSGFQHSSDGCFLLKKQQRPLRYSPHEISGRINFSRRDLVIWARLSAPFWPPRFLNPGRILAAEIQESRQDFGRQKLGILAGFSPPRFRNLGTILAAEIQESWRDCRHDFARRELGISAGFWPPRFRNLGRILATEISEFRQDFGRPDF